MELSRLRAEVARLKMERDILKKVGFVKHGQGHFYESRKWLSPYAMIH
jgi:hypothetical protein